MGHDVRETDRLIEREIAALQGAWRQVGLEADGVVDPPDALTVSGALTHIDGTHFLVRAPDGTVVIEGAFDIDPTATPKRITWIDAIGPDAGKRLPAIYTLDGDRFRFVAADEGQTWPTAFTTSPGLTMRTFVRHRQKSNPPHA